MKNSRKNEGIDELKTLPTSIKTMADLRGLLSNTDATPSEVNAILEIVSGQSTVNGACEGNKLGTADEPVANRVNRFRNRLATILMDAIKHIATPVIAHYETEAANLAKIENQEATAEKLAKWEASGKHGRKPGEGNRPKHEIAIEKAHKTARQDARKDIGIAAQGRIVPDLQGKYAEKFRAHYSKSLKAIIKENSLDWDETKIEKLINKGVKDLKVEASAQKAVIAKQTAKKAAKQTVKKTEEVPSVESTPVINEPV